jgi:predicted MFS family arabinose efflux permease
LATANNLNFVLLGTAIWGLHLGLTQGLLSAYVADTAPADARGSAFGVFYFVSGMAAILASVLAGAMWEWRGPAATFWTGATFSVLAFCGLTWWRFRFRRNEEQDRDEP